MAKNKEIELTDEQMDIVEDGGEVRVYELGFHLDPELPTEEVKKTYQSLREAITANGTVVAEGEPQKIPLAYTISRQETSGRRDFDTAYFAWIAYEMSATSHASVLSTVNAEKRVVRFIDLVTTKDSARHAVEIRELALKMPEHNEDSESVAGAELDAALENVVV